jgi:SM-20-related protein
MPSLDLDSLRAAMLTREPFEYLIVTEFVRPQARPGIHADFPVIDRPGSFPLSELEYGPAFRNFVEELRGPEMRQAFAEKFQIDLRGRPTMVTVRGLCRERDGTIHTDAASKLITALIYLNPTWEHGGGRLRLLRSATDIEDVVAEVPPVEGTLLAFRRSDNSFHGHKPFAGPRRVIQLNWVTSRAVLWRETWRHRLSALIKRRFKPDQSSKRAA